MPPCLCRQQLWCCLLLQVQEQRSWNPLDPKRPSIAQGNLLCQLTCQSADIMASFCGVCVHVHVRMNDFSKTIRPRDMLLILKDTLST